MENLRGLRISFNLTQDELSKKLMIEDRTLVSQYETRANPSIKVLLQYAELFGLTFDFIVLNKNCNYPHNLRLLTLAKEFDGTAQSQDRSHVETSAEILLKEKKAVDIKQDKPDLELTESLHQNLKDLRSFKGKSQEETANFIGVKRSSITGYERNIIPPVDNLVKLSDFFDVSMHALVTGQKLNFQFTDGPFGKTILMADKFLSIDHQKFLIELMENILSK